MAIGKIRDLGGSSSTPVNINITGQINHSQTTSFLTYDNITYNFNTVTNSIVIPNILELTYIGSNNWNLLCSYNGTITLSNVGTFAIVKDTTLSFNSGYNVNNTVEINLQ